MSKTRRSVNRVGDFLALERNVLRRGRRDVPHGLGEELWKRFLPKYPEGLGATLVAIDRYGRRLALLLFVGLAAVGYAADLTAPSWPVVFLGLVSRWRGRAWPRPPYLRR